MVCTVFTRGQDKELVLFNKLDNDNNNAQNCTDAKGDTVESEDDSWVGLLQEGVNGRILNYDKSVSTRRRQDVDNVWVEHQKDGK